MGQHRQAPQKSLGTLARLQRFQHPTSRSPGLRLVLRLGLAAFSKTQSAADELHHAGFFFRDRRVRSQVPRIQARLAQTRHRVVHLADLLVLEDRLAQFRILRQILARGLLNRCQLGKLLKQQNRALTFALLKGKHLRREVRTLRTVSLFQVRLHLHGRFHKLTARLGIAHQLVKLGIDCKSIAQPPLSQQMLSLMRARLQILRCRAPRLQEHHIAGRELLARCTLGHLQNRIGVSARLPIPQRQRLVVQGPHTRNRGQGVRRRNTGRCRTQSKLRPRIAARNHLLRTRIQPVEFPQPRFRLPGRYTKLRGPRPLGRLL